MFSNSLRYSTYSLRFCYLPARASNSWEPKENLNSALIEHYNKKQKPKLKLITHGLNIPNKTNPAQHHADRQEEEENENINKKLQALKESYLIYPQIVIDEYVTRLKLIERQNKAMNR